MTLSTSSSRAPDTDRNIASTYSDVKLMATAKAAPRVVLGFDGALEQDDKARFEKGENDFQE